jgi:hypothetical protein
MKRFILFIALCCVANLFAIDDINLSEFVPGKVSLYVGENEQIHVIGFKSSNELYHQVRMNNDQIVLDDLLPLTSGNLDLVLDISLVEFDSEIYCIVTFESPIEQVLIDVTSGQVLNWGDLDPEIESIVYAYQNGENSKFVRVNGKSTPSREFGTWHNESYPPNYNSDNLRKLYLRNSNHYRKLSINDRMEFFIYGNSQNHFFNELVYVEELVNNGAYDLDEYLLAGYIDESKGHSITSQDTQDYTMLFGDNIDADYVYMVVNGDEYSAKSVKVLYEEQHLTVYDSYPPYGEIGDSIGVNILDMPIDTVIVDLGNGNLSDCAKIYIPCDLYIEGTFSDYNSIYATGNIYITDDILLEGTEIGEHPDGLNDDLEQIDTPNEIDFVQLHSDKSIFIKYKNIDYFNIDDNGNYPIKDTNCDGIYIYADIICKNQDQLFTFEYQHVHPSTPPVEIDGELHYPDLHLNQYDESTGIWEMEEYYVTNNAFPDQPWYNPVWPEINPVYERGSLHIFGSVFAHNFGFSHRSGSDPANHSNNDDWDIENGLYGPNHGSTGYDKIMYHDYRESPYPELEPTLYYNDDKFSLISHENGMMISDELDFDVDVTDKQFHPQLELKQQHQKF